MKKFSSLFYLLLIFMSLLMSGCGGGGVSLPPLPTFVPGSVSNSEREAAYAEVEALFLSVRSQSNAAAQLVAKMKKMSQFATAEIGESGDAIGWFKDGRMYAVFTTDSYTPKANFNRSDPKSTIKKKGRDLPGEPTAYLINAFEPAREDASALIANQLNDKLYDTIVRNGTVNDYMSIRDAGLLFVHAHGLIATDDKRVTHFWYATSDTPNTTQDLLLKQYIDSGQLSTGSGESYDSQGNVTIVRKYIISDQFLHDVGTTFAKNATWISQSCSSFNPYILKSTLDPSSGFQGVANYGGWTLPEDSTESTSTSTFIFDRLLGTNLVQPIEPNKPAPLTITELNSKLLTTTRPGGGLAYGTSTTSSGVSKFRWATAPGSNVPTIIPSIESASVNETDNLLEISGHFGSASGAVTLDGGNLNVQSWSETLVKVTKPEASEGTLVLRSLGGASASGQLRSNSYDYAGLGILINPGSVLLAKQATQAFTVSTTSGTVPNGAKYRWTVTGLGKVNGSVQVVTTIPSATYKAPNQDTSDLVKVEVVSSSNKVLATATVAAVVGQNQVTFTLSPGAGWPENVGTHSYNDGDGQSYTSNSNHDIYSLDYNVDTTDPDLHPRASIGFELPHGTPLVAGQVIDQALNNTNPTLIGFTFATARYLNQPYDGTGYYDITGITSTGKMTILSATTNSDGSKTISYSLFVNKSDGSPAITATGSCRIVYFGP
ncbi:MAG: hypothetical protein WCI55_05580 [Armatimonadota bacterium]